MTAKQRNFILVLCFLFVAAVVAIACTNSSGNFQEPTPDAKFAWSYVKDSRTNPPLCFATSWVGGAYGGPIMTNVPCEPIPASLLTTVHPLPNP